MDPKIDKNWRSAGSGGPFRDILGAKWVRKSIKIGDLRGLGDLFVTFWVPSGSENR